MKLQIESEADADEYLARPFDAWALAEKQGHDALVDLDRTPIASLPLQAAERAQSAWKLRQRYLVREQGLPEESEAKSPREQFEFALRCERRRLDLASKAGDRSGARIPGGVVLSMVLEGVLRGLLPPPWLEDELQPRADLIWTGQQSEWNAADVFGRPPWTTYHTGTRPNFRAEAVLAPDWYKEAIGQIFEKCRLDYDVTTATKNLESVKGDGVKAQRKRSKLRGALDAAQKALDEFMSSKASKIGALSDSVVYRRIAAATKERSPQDALSAKRIRHYVDGCVQRAGGRLPSLAEFEAILSKYPAISIQGALDHWYWSSYWEKSSAVFSHSDIP
jgi:hypothetical protein